MIKQNYNVTDRVNYRADAKRFTHRRCKKLTLCQFLDGAKKLHHVKNSSVNSANDIRNNFWKSTTLTLHGEEISLVIDLSTRIAIMLHGPEKFFSN